VRVPSASGQQLLCFAVISNLARPGLTQPQYRRSTQLVTACISPEHHGVDRIPIAYLQPASFGRASKMDVNAWFMRHQQHELLSCPLSHHSVTVTNHLLWWMLTASRQSQESGFHRL
jgi:hypothetical protein